MSYNCTFQVLHQDETPLLYSLVFGEGVVNDATSIVLFRAVQNLDLTQIDVFTVLEVLGEFIYLYFSSTVMGIVVSKIWRVMVCFINFELKNFGDLMHCYQIRRLFLMQVGLGSAFIIKKLYFGR
jgi:hypothetical protein